MNTLRRFIKDESGISVTEYGLLIAFVAIALIIVVQMAGSKISGFFSKHLNSLSSPAVSP